MPCSTKSVCKQTQEITAHCVTLTLSQIQPEIEKAERYIVEIMKVEIPQLKSGEIAEIISRLKNKSKLIVFDKASGF